jgi:hypothetical protein
MISLAWVRVRYWSHIYLIELGLNFFYETWICHNLTSCFSNMFKKNKKLKKIQKLQKIKINQAVKWQQRKKKGIKIDMTKMEHGV